MSDLFKELEQDLRNERMNRLWGRFGVLMLMVSLVVIVATIATVAWQNHRREQAQAMTSRFILATEHIAAGNYDEALRDLDALVAENHADYVGPALLAKAVAQSRNKDEDGARETYRKLAEHQSLYGDLAKSRLADAEAQPSSVFSYSQNEHRAWRLLSEGKRDEAVTLLDKLERDGAAPASQRQRLALLLQQLAPERRAPEAEAAHAAP